MRAGQCGQQVAAGHRIFQHRRSAANPGRVDKKFRLQDHTLKFGSLTMTRGKAFAIKTTNASPSTVNSSTINSVPVYKSWVHLQGRTFLIEEVPLAHLAAALDALPLTCLLYTSDAAADLLCV